jgi:CheY-like chemotaxis protein
MTSPAPSTILIVEDEKDIRESLQEVLEYEGYKVHSAVHGREALALLDTIPSPPDLILLDLMMPVMNGWDFANAVASHPTHFAIPIVVVSAFPERAAPLNPKAILKKPIDLYDLIAAVKKNIDA